MDIGGYPESRELWPAVVHHNDKHRTQQPAAVPDTDASYSVPWQPEHEFLNKFTLFHQSGHWIRLDTTLVILLIVLINH